MPKRQFSDVFVVVAAFAVNLAWLLIFLIADPEGTLLCLSIFLSFFALFSFCLWRGINPVRLLPPLPGQLLCGMIAALLLYFAWSEEGTMEGVLIALSIVMMVVTLIYPIFSVFPDTPMKQTPSTPSAPLPAPPARPKPAPARKHWGKRRRRY